METAFQLNGTPNHSPTVPPSERVFQGHFLRQIRTSLKIVLLLLLCTFTAAPALALWRFSYKAGDDALQSMVFVGHQSVQDMGQDVRRSMIVSARGEFLRLVEPSELAIQSMSYFVKSSSVATWNGIYAGRNYSEIIKLLFPTIFFIDRPHPQISQCVINLWINQTYRQPVFIYKIPNESFQSAVLFRFSDHQARFIGLWTVISRIGIDVVTNQYTSTLYIAELAPNENYNDTAMTYYYINQDTGERLFSLFSVSYGRFGTDVGDLSLPEFVQWGDVLDFNQQIGQPQIYIDFQLPFKDLKACLRVSVTTNVWLVSTFLKNLLHGTKQRLFLNFRNPNGELIGASHGKFFSHSDIDYSMNNPLTNPPPVSQFRRYSPLNSSDDTIFSASQWMMRTFDGWDRIPELNDVIYITGENFWIASSVIVTSLGLKTNLVLLVDEQSQLNAIDGNRTQALNNISGTNTRLTAIFVTVVVVALLLALAVSWVVARSLGRLAGGMDCLSVLRFGDKKLRGIKTIRSRFTEIARCERSFTALERGLRAFVKYVPFEVVRLMLTGEMVSEQLMIRKIVTILFTDIVAFSSLCERLTAEQLVQLTQRYLQAMCEIITGHKGTLDKFVGDCIMAIFNAPRNVEGHSSYAVGSALDMQTRMMRLNHEIKQSELLDTDLHFRVGINTDSVLVGNYGCEYRINYTCLGDGVNLASRLEGANKHFNTVVLVSESTFLCVVDEHAEDVYFCHKQQAHPSETGGAQNTSSSGYPSNDPMRQEVIARQRQSAPFCFRKVAHITVPGKSQVVAVYEPLCWQQQQPENGNSELPATSTTAASPPTTSPPRASRPVIAPRLMPNTADVVNNENGINNSDPPSFPGSNSCEIDSSRRSTSAEVSRNMRPRSDSMVPLNPAMSPTTLSPTSPFSGEAYRVSEDHPTIWQPETPPRAGDGEDGDALASSNAREKTKLLVLYRWQLVLPSTLIQLATLYEKGLVEFIRGDLATASTWLQQAQRLLPEDGPTALLLDRCRSAVESHSHMQHPYASLRPANWDGVIRFDQK